MNYERMPTNVTMISDLPDVDDLENMGGGYRTGPSQLESGHQNNEKKYEKFIRPSQRLMPESGMIENVMKPPNMMGMAGSPHITEMFDNRPHMNISCIDISKHIQECPICSKFYHNDKTVYVIIIVVLCVICLLLLKKVLNV